jgi:AAA15 family ATPase/GTPase
VPQFSRVQIENYKSIEKLDFEARRVTIFIGGPNAGKSNILESLAFLSPGLAERFKETFRVRQAAELFRDNAIENVAKLTINSGLAWQLKFEREQNRFRTDFKFPNGSQPSASIFGPQDVGPNWHDEESSSVRFFAYRRELFANGKKGGYGALVAPFGENLPAMLYSDKSFRESVSALFKAHGHRLELRPQSSEILISKEVDDILYSYPFDSISETLRRIVFYKAALETNRDRVLILDEPEANTFPFYTKYLAERIALDETNQFFLTTHNPYVLMSIIEKTPRADLAVYVTRMRSYRTEVHRLSDAELAEALELSMDIFLNLERYFPD